MVKNEKKQANATKKFAAKILFCFENSVPTSKLISNVIFFFRVAHPNDDVVTDTSIVVINENVIPFVTTNQNSIDSYISTAFPKIRFNLSSSSPSSPSFAPKSTESQNAINQTVPDGFLVWSPSCQMLAMEPLARDVMKLFHRGKQTANYRIRIII